MKAIRETWVQASRRKLILGFVLAVTLLLLFLLLPEGGEPGFEKNFFSVLMVGALGFWLGLVLGDKFFLSPLESERDRLWREAVRKRLTDDLTYDRSVNDGVLFLSEYSMDREKAFFTLYWLHFYGEAPVENEQLYRSIESFVFNEGSDSASKCLELLKDDIICFDKEKQMWRLSPRLERFLYWRIFLRNRSWLPGDELTPRPA